MTEQLQLRRGNAAQVAAFTGAPGEVVVDTTNNRAIIDDGATAGGWPAAKLAEVITNTYVGVADAPYAAQPTDRTIGFTALTVSRVVTLPAAALFPTGTELTVADETGSCSLSKTITLSAQGSDTVNGGGGAVISWANGVQTLISDGVSKWTIVNTRLPTKFRTPVADANYTSVANDRLIAFTALTASRTVSLIASSSYPSAAAGALLIIVDESGACSPAKTLTVTPNGSDTIDEVNGSVVLNTPNAALILESNGAGGWTILHERQPAPPRTAVSDAAYSATITDRLIAYTALTAQRTVSLPAAAAYPTGTPLTVVDESGSVTPTNDIVVAPNGSDTINGANTSALIQLARGYLTLESNGANGWTIVGQAKWPATPAVIGQSHIPFVFSSSGSMGNNGALSGLTAQPVAWAGAYVYLPAGAIASGSAAGWYYAEFSSTTAATVFNNAYSSGTPQIPGSPTAFATTGPGAFAQTTAAFIAAYQLTVPGNTLGINGSLRVTANWATSSSTNAKTPRVVFGSETIGSTANSTTADISLGWLFGVANNGATDLQTITMTTAGTPTNAGATAFTQGAVDTTTNQTLAAQMNLATATDFITLVNMTVELIPGVP